MIIKRSIWFACLLLQLAAGDFGVHCWRFQVTGWDESPPPRVNMLAEALTGSGLRLMPW